MNRAHYIVARYVGPTNTLGARIALETWDLERNKKTRKFYGWKYEHNFEEQLGEILEGAGLKELRDNWSHPEHVAITAKWDHEALKRLFGVKS